MIIIIIIIRLLHQHRFTHTRVHARTHARTHARKQAREHARAYARTHERKHARRTHARTNARTHERTHVRTHTHTHIHARARTHARRITYTFDMEYYIENEMPRTYFTPYPIIIIIIILLYNYGKYWRPVSMNKLLSATISNTPRLNHCSPCLENRWTYQKRRVQHQASVCRSPQQRTTACGLPIAAAKYYLQYSSQKIVNGTPVVIMSTDT